MSKPIVILKIGTASITTDSGVLDEAVMVEIARQLGTLHDQYNWIVVSSGAVGNGKSYLRNYQGSIIERKAAAAIGNPILLQKYAQFLSPYKISIAQSLCERTHFSKEEQFNQLKQTFMELWKNGVIPIANENDVVSNLELKFSDNDELATLLAVGFGASMLLLGTSVAGVIDRDGKTLSQISNIDEQILSLATNNLSSNGLGGMISKLTFARLATKMGIQTVIFDIRKSGGILEAIQKKTGTVCLAHQGSKKQRQRWLSSGNIVRGKVVIKKETLQLLQDGKGLLNKHVSEIVEPFAKGEVFEILDSQRRSVAVARSLVTSNSITSNDSSEKALATESEIILL
ncbi:MAG: glutamate 5-kinase [Cyclobacteriaceae bacterium]|nr:MAG: glutamate 5-kinase [Cyclobacteriaceae bacterium]